MAAGTITDTQKYHMALGEFVEKFAMAEAALQVSLWHLCGLDMDTARAIFAGGKVSDAVACIRRVLEARQATMPEGAHDVFEQFGAIAFIRNKLVHLGTTEHEPDGGRLLTNRLFAINDRKLYERSISVDEIESMAVDLGTVTTKVLVIFVGKPTWFPQDKWEDYLARAQIPWLYIRPKPNAKRPSLLDGGL